MITKRIRLTTLASLLALALVAPAGAGDSAAPSSDQGAPAPAAPPAEACINSTTGTCCATCQEQAARAKAAEQGGEHDCPCKRARAKAAQQGS